ncbi:MAG: hypothetical protein WBV22_10110 [Anaerolineaceae bacterium]
MIKPKILAGLSLLILVTVACGLTNTISSGAQQVATLAGNAQNLAGEVQALATTAANAVPQGAMEDPRAYLIDALSKQMMSEPFRSTMTMVSAGKTTNYTVEFQPPDRFHMVMPGVVEGVIIGQQGYMKQGDTWLQVPLSADFSSAFGLLGPDAVKAFDAIQNVKFAGAEVLDGRPTLIFTYTSDVTVAGVASTSTNRLWLGATDGRVYQIVVDGEAAGVKSTTTIIYEYDPSIKVEAPV